MAVIVQEVKGSPVINRTRAGISIKHTYQFAWDQRWTFLLEYMNAVYPDASWAALGVSVSIQPWGKMLASTDSTVAKYEQCRGTVEYATLTAHQINNPTEEGAVTERIEGNAEYTELAPDGFQWGPGADADAVSENEAPGRMASGGDYFITVHNIASAPTHILDYLNCVNKESLSPTSSQFSNLTFPPETLLFMPPVISNATIAGGGAKITVDYRFSYRPNWDKPGVTGAVAYGWNAFWRAKLNNGVGGYQRIYAEGVTEVDNYYRNFPAVVFTGVFT